MFSGDCGVVSPQLVAAERFGTAITAGLLLLPEVVTSDALDVAKMASEEREMTAPVEEEGLTSKCSMVWRLE